MKIYHYHEKTGQLIGMGQADRCQVKEGDWLIPAFATSEKPPSVKAGQAAFFIDGAWTARDLPTEPETKT